MTNMQDCSPETAEGDSGARLKLLLRAETELARALDDTARQFNAERSWSQKEGLADRIGVLTLSIARLARVLDPARPRSAGAPDPAPASTTERPPAARNGADAASPTDTTSATQAPPARSAAPAPPAGERRLKKPADIVFGRSECGRYLTIDEEDLYEDPPDPARVEARPQWSPPDPGEASAASGSPRNERKPPEIGGRPGAVLTAGPSDDP